MAKGLIVPPAVQYSVLELVKAHGPARVRWAIAAAVEKTNRGAPSLGFMRKLAEEGPLADTPRRSFLSAPARPIGGVAITPPETARAWEQAAQEEAALRESMPLCPSCNGESGDCGAWARASPAGPAWVCHGGRARDAEPYEIQMQAELRPAREWRNTGT